MMTAVALVTLVSEDDLRPARRAVKEVAEQLPFDSKQVAEITLAVAEACANGVRYGICRGHSPRVTVVTEPADDYLAIEVEDHGRGFAPPIPRMPDPSSESGRGIALMHALMDQVAITSTHHGTRVRMVKYFSR